jgi:hypothetical protein
MQQLDALTGTKTAGKTTTPVGIWAPPPKSDIRQNGLLGTKNSLLAKVYEGLDDKEKQSQAWNFRPLNSDRNVEAENLKQELSA